MSELREFRERTNVAKLDLSQLVRSFDGEAYDAELEDELAAEDRRREALEQEELDAERGCATRIVFFLVTAVKFHHC